jgi:hypothetical protein
MTENDKTVEANLLDSPLFFVQYVRNQTIKKYFSLALPGQPYLTIKFILLFQDDTLSFSTSPTRTSMGVKSHM